MLCGFASCLVLVHTSEFGVGPSEKQREARQIPIGYTPRLHLVLGIRPISQLVKGTLQTITTFWYDH